MASTYPLEIVEAARWVKANPDVKDKALEDAMQKQNWDERQVTYRLPAGADDDERETRHDPAVGRRIPGAAKGRHGCRPEAPAKAQAEGNLKTTPGAKGNRRASPGDGYRYDDEHHDHQNRANQPGSRAVPTYNPTVVCGAWPYPAYPPYYLPTSMWLQLRWFRSVSAWLWEPRAGAIAIGATGMWTSTSTTTTTSIRPISKIRIGSTTSLIARVSNTGIRRPSSAMVSQTSRPLHHVNRFVVGRSRVGRTSREAALTSSKAQAALRIAQAPALVKPAPGDLRASKSPNCQCRRFGQPIRSTAGIRWRNWTKSWSKRLSRNGRRRWFDTELQQSQRMASIERQTFGGGGGRGGGGGGRGGGGRR